DRSGFAQFRRRIARHYSRHCGLESSFGDQTLAFADFARVDRAGISFQCGGWNFLRFLSRAESRRARSDRGIALRMMNVGKNDEARMTKEVGRLSFIN